MKRIAQVSLLICGVLAGLYGLNWLGVIAWTNSDGRAVASTIADELSKQTGEDVHVTCPNSIPEKRGGIEDCHANAGHGTTLIRLTQDDSRGHFHYVVNDVSVLIPDPVQVRADFLTACTGTGGDQGQCGCIYDLLSPADAQRAEASYTAGEGLPGDLGPQVDSCRVGA